MFGYNYDLSEMIQRFFYLNPPLTKVIWCGIALIVVAVVAKMQTQE